MTGYAWNTKFIEGPITGMQDLMNDEWRGHVSLFGNNADAPNMAMIELGIDPDTSGPDEWQQAADLLSSFNEWGGLRKWDDQAYLTAIENEDIWATMAWSGDIINDKLYYPEFETFEFATAEAGGVVWVDNMMIPAGAENPLGAIQVMDHYYRPDMAALLTEWNAYVSPVPAAGDIVQADADAASGGDKAVLETIATSPYVFPTPEIESKLHTYRVLEGEEIEQWNDIFLPIFTTCGHGGGGPARSPPPTRSWRREASGSSSCSSCRWWRWRASPCRKAPRSRDTASPGTSRTSRRPRPRTGSS
jgi:spermidine/putrescine transport system substrate-binding protein